MTEAKWKTVPVEPTEDMMTAAFRWELRAGLKGRGRAYGIYRAMLAAAPSAPPQPRWRTMDSAPKDGTEIIMHGPVPDGYPARVTVGWWDAPERGDYLGDCGGECRCPDYDEPPEPCWFSMDGGFTDEYPPTHWTPLPPPPGSGESHAPSVEGLVEANARFQEDCREWAEKCFGAAIADDREERCDRFIEEALELVQSVGWSRERAHSLVDYVFDRPAGKPSQEVGGVMVTLACLCAAHGLHMTRDGAVELTRINAPEVVEKIRAKQAAKPTGSALPVALSRLEEGK